MDERSTKRRGPFLWLAAKRRSRLAFASMLALLVLYVASFGPACWLTARPLQPARLAYEPLIRVYIPLGWFIDHDLPGSRLLVLWMTLGAPHGSTVCVPVNTQFHELCFGV